MSSLRESFLNELADLYDAEKQLVKALPKMAKAAEHDELRSAFEEHLEETKGHVERLEQVFEAFDEKAKGKKCKAMQGLLEEGQESIEDEEGDAMLICAAQKVEHYEIASYGTLLAWAKLLNEGEVQDLLRQNFEEEEAADNKLTELGESVINVEESQEETEEETRAGSSSRPRRR